jgi:cytochrome oxidase Cu insertion factor (SCO1/SenC/PrrC family)
MDSGLNTNDPTLVAAFRSALLHQAGIIIVIFLALLLAYGIIRSRRAVAASPPRPPASVAPAAPAAPAEPRARRVLRMGFGILWIIDGILQAQPQMAGGLPSQVVAPGVSAAPGWVQDVANFGGTIWSFHPVQAAASTVWIQVGLGLWLICAESGWPSRLAGLGSAAWGLLVWVFGEAFGGIFAPGLSWLTGAPGAVVLYVTAGICIALPPRAWAGPRLGRLLLGGIGLFWIGMAVLQAWPGRGFWGGLGGTLTAMVQGMAGLTQPHAQEAIVSSFASFNIAHGFAVNLFAVIALSLAGLAFLSGRPRVLRVAVPAATVFCLADWVLVQDLGMPGGLGTDPNSMVPWVLLLWGGYVALTQAPDMSGQLEASVRQHRFSLGALRHPALWRPALRPGALGQEMTRATARSVVSFGAFGAVLVGVVPMALASANRTADPILAHAISGQALTLDRRAPDFQLVSQSGQPVSMTSLRGKTVMLTFLDPLCTVDCPVTQELREASNLLGGSGQSVELVAIAANPIHYDMAFTRSLDQQEGLASVPNWVFLTGTLSELRQTWSDYGIRVAAMAPGSSLMSDLVFVIDKTGRIRVEIRDNPGPGTVSTRSSFAVVMRDAARQAMSLGGTW